MKKYLLFITILIILPLTAHGIAVVGPYDTISTSAGNWGVNGTSASSHEYLFNGQQYRIRQTGDIQRIQMYVSTLTNVTSVYFRVWRNIGGTWTLINTSENLLSSLTGGQTNTIDLNTSIRAEMGDYYGYRITWNGTGSYFATARTGITGMDGYIYADNATTTTGFNWGAQTTVTSAVPILMYMNNPNMVFIGDSIIQGAPNNYAFTQDLTTTDISTTIEYKVATPHYFTFQNLGHGGDTTTQIYARISTDCVNLKPSYCIIDGGVNDLYQEVATTTFTNNWTNILSTISSAGIKPVVMLILPWNLPNGTAANMIRRDDWNEILTGLANTYGAIIVDGNPYVGQFRSGGEAGNLWDIQASYVADDDLGVHYTPVGNTQIADAISDSMGLFDRETYIKTTGQATIKDTGTSVISK